MRKPKAAVPDRLPEAGPVALPIVLTRLDLRGRLGAGCSGRELAALLPRAAVDVSAATTAVADTVRDVAERGDDAVRDASQRYDGVTPRSLRVPAEELRRALEELDPALRAALQEAARRARLVHEAQRPADVEVTVVPGGTVVERQVPVARVGLYVPGGRVAYPSSVVMNVVPAQAAGVTELAVASPPQRENRGLPHPAVLAACALLGVTEVYAVGGAQAVAMFAYGTASCPAVDVITGPGNVYVAAAKRLVAGVVGIDSEAGPTEVAILADAGADASYVAADLIAQAEHDPLAACLLVSDDADLLDRVDRELRLLVPGAAHEQRVRAAFAGQSAAVLVDDLEAGLAVVDAFAPEHLEIQTRDAAARARRVRHAGAIFIGPYTPVSLGDYLAGSNHVLPTGGTARFSGGLTTATFLRPVHLVHYDRRALAGTAEHIRVLGGAEDLHGHVEAVAVRLREPEARL